MTIASIFAQSYSANVSSNRRSKFLGIDKKFFSIIVPSWISGFLVGPKLLEKHNGQIDKTDYVIITSNAGIGFVISLVGVTLWNNLLFGIYLFAVQIITAIVLFNLTKKRGFVSSDVTSSPVPMLTGITNAVNQSTKTMLDICGFTIFFSVVKLTACTILKIKKNSIFFEIISSFLEISDGVLTSSKISNSSLAGFFTGFCIGFGGLCMIVQTISVCKNKINALKFFSVKFIQGIICGNLSLLYVKFFNLNSTGLIYTSLTYDIDIHSIITNCFFIFLLLNYTKKSIFKLI